MTLTTSRDTLTQETHILDIPLITWSVLLVLLVRVVSQNRTIGMCKFKGLRALLSALFLAEAVA